MALLNLVEPNEATGKVAEVYESMIKGMGFVPNAFKVFSPSPHLLESQVKNLFYFSSHKTLSGKLLALTRLLVSTDEFCEYCVGMNTGILMQYGILPEQLSEVKKDPSKAPLDEKELALLLFVLKVVKNSNGVTKSDVDAVRAHGWSDADILDATFHGTAQVGTDRIFNAFKIEKEG